MEDPYFVGIVDIENGHPINWSQASKEDAEVFGVRDEIEELDDGLDGLDEGRPPRVVYGGRCEEFERERQEKQEELSPQLGEPSFEEIIDAAIENNASKLYRFFPEELQNRIDQRKAAVPDIRPQNPESTERTASKTSEIYQEEVAKYEEEILGNVVDYDEIKRNSAALWAKNEAEIFYVEGYAMLRDLNGEEEDFGDWF